jgi:hypothetical protein
MLVPFVVDSECLTPDHEWSAQQQRACHNNFLDVWQRIGLLIHDGISFNASRLHEAVARLPQNLRSLWQETLKRVPVVAIGNAWQGCVTVQTLPEIVQAARLAFVDDTQALVSFEFTDECDEKNVVIEADLSVTICRLLAAGHACAFQTAIEAAGTHIEARHTYDEIWKSRFRTLAIAPIKPIAIVDRYAVSRHFYCPQSQLSGLERFVRLLDQGAAGQRYITLYSAWTGDISGPNRKNISDIATELHEILEHLTKRNVVGIRVVMSPDNVFTGVAHDRFVRFGNYLWDIGQGLTVFEGPCAGTRSSASFKTGASIRSYEQVERDLTSHANTVIQDVT